MSLQMPQCDSVHRICLLASVLWNLCKAQATVLQGQTGWVLFMGGMSSPPQNPEEGLTLDHQAVTG